MWGIIRPGSSDKCYPTDSGFHITECAHHFRMYPRPKTMSRAPCSGRWWNSVGIESNQFRRFTGSFLLCKSHYMRLVCSKIQFEIYFTESYLSNNILFFGWVCCLLQKSLELQPNPNYFNQEISPPCLRVNCLIKKRKLRIGDKTAYHMRWIWWDPEEMR